MEQLPEIDITSAEFGDLYDELPLWSAPFGLMLLDRVPMKPGSTILDVGAGTGFLTIELAERCGSDVKVIAVDPWQAAVDRLRRKINQRHLKNIVVLQQGCETLELPEASVDLIVSNLGINNFSDPERALENCHRVARPGAKLLLTTNLVGHMAEFYDTLRTILIEEGQSDQLDALEAHVNHRGTIDSVTWLLRRSGFEIVETVTDSFRMRFADGSSLLRHYFVRFAFLPAWKRVVIDSPSRIFATLERRLNQVAEQNGELALTIPMACVVARKPCATDLPTASP